jgi:hypothetical protein
MASVVISDKSLIPSKIKSKSYPVAKLDAIATEILPFRVRFTNIGLLGATAGIPGIGLQIIGINNYIL